ncbi:hypothetical protein ABZ208_07620 [Streptomyces sp. NPDC006208]|uniref:hypothetical protein n=1 Tax=Streptomyces sp. NPDC006208 TaxID=3156734 RepID=UPI00339F8C83
MRGFAGFGVGFAVVVRFGERLGEGLGFGERPAVTEGDEDRNTVGADCPTVGVGLVEPTTKWTETITAVTLVVVHDSHMSK